MRTNDTKHRRIFEKHHGRKIKPGYHIHHIDGDHTNNNPANLVEVTASEHYEIHKQQGDYGACILLSKAADISAHELNEIQHLHGVTCVENKVGIHNDNFDHSARSREMWKKTPPGRKPVTNGVRVLKFKTQEEVDDFLRSNTDWRMGIPDDMKQGLRQTTRRLTSNESKLIAEKRLSENTHNFIIEYECPHCGKVGKGPMMHRWHFDNCKSKGDIL